MFDLLPQLFCGRINFLPSEERVEMLPEATDEVGVATRYGGEAILEGLDKLMSVRTCSRLDLAEGRMR